MKLKTIININILTQVQPHAQNLKDKIFEWTSWFFLVAVMIILIFLFLVMTKTFIIDKSDWAVNRAHKKTERKVKELEDLVEQLKEKNRELMKNSRPVALNGSVDCLLQRTKEAETKIKIEKLAKLLNRAINLELLFEVAVAVGDTELVKLIKDVEEIIK